jgi:hypothetical protein
MNWLERACIFASHFVVLIKTGIVSLHRSHLLSSPQQPHCYGVAKSKTIAIYFAPA